MINLNVFFDVQQPHEAEFIKLLNHMVIESNKEHGCEMYQLYRNAHNPYQYTLIEHWTTQGDLDAHAESEHWKHFDATVNDYLTVPYEEHHYTEIPA